MRGLGRDAVCPPGIGREQAIPPRDVQGRPTAVDRFVAMMGDLWSHIRTVNDLIPEVAQLDCLVFEATITSTTITQPGNVKVPSQYAFDMYGYGGYISEPGLNVANFPLITWNSKEVGKRNVFGTDQSMAQLLNILGPNPPLTFPRSLYLFSPGADISMTFARASGWNGGSKTVGVFLLGGLVAPSQARR